LRIIGIVAKKLTEIFIKNNIMSNWEQKLKNWTKPPSDSEEEKCTNAESMIRDAITSDEEFKDKNIEIFGQGSYKNNTNVRLNSDVDICVKLKDTFFYKLPDGTNPEDFNISSSSYSFNTYKDSVHQALINKFGTSNIKRGDKSIKVASNTYRVDADVVPCFEHRRYKSKGSFKRLVGVEFRSDSGEKIKNWPKQHYNNGVRKNKNTNRRYKRIVRILKKIDYELEQQGVSIAKSTPSYLLECLVWNVPNSILVDSKEYYPTVKKTIQNLYKNLDDREKSKDWGEVNELQYLFHPGQNWSRDIALKFLERTWSFLEY
jgi:hypothetical protein